MSPSVRTTLPDATHRYLKLRAEIKGVSLSKMVGEILKQWAEAEKERLRRVGLKRY